MNTAVVSKELVNCFYKKARGKNLVRMWVTNSNPNNSFPNRTIHFSCLRICVPGEGGNSMFEGPKLLFDEPTAISFIGTFALGNSALGLKAVDTDFLDMIGVSNWVASLPEEIRKPKEWFMFWNGKRLLKQGHLLVFFSTMVFEQIWSNVHFSNEQNIYARATLVEQLNNLNSKSWRTIQRVLG